MKKVIFVGNRPNVLEKVSQFSELSLLKVYALEESLLCARIPHLGKGVDTKVFSLSDKKNIIEDIISQDFDILISNGCPFILPISTIRKDHQLFINIHPTILPDLKGKTPLSGVFITHAPYLGATMHYMDDGIDTGGIIFQKKVKRTLDIDQGLVYKISFDLEGEAFTEGMKLLIEKGFDFPGTKQPHGGSYFNRTQELQTINPQLDGTDKIIDTIKSFGVKGQGSYLTVETISYRVYAAERIVNDYLLETYAHTKPSKVAFAYDDKIIIRTTDGMIKLTDYEVIKEGGET